MMVVIPMVVHHQHRHLSTSPVPVGHYPISPNVVFLLMLLLFIVCMLYSIYYVNHQK